MLPARTLPPRHLVRVRALLRCDIDFVVALHREQFPDNAASRLGRFFLRAYYASFVASPHAIAYAVECDGRIAGFLVGIVRTGEHRRRLLRRHLPWMLPAAVLGALLSPGHAFRLAKARLRRSDQRSTGPAGTAAYAVLSHIAVEDHRRGTGLGAALMDHFETEAWNSGATRLLLATTDDSGAGVFYERRGWRSTHQRQTFDGRSITLYALDGNRCAP